MSIIALCLLSAVGIYVYASQVVEIEVSQMPNVDIILTKSPTTVNLNDFEERLEEELVAQGVMSQSEIDSGKVNIQAIDTNTVSTNDADASTIFNTWQKYPSIPGAIFQANWSLVGNVIRTNADVHWTGYWDYTKEDETSDYKISFDVYSGDSFWQDPYEFTFRMTNPNENEYSFYAVEFCGNNQYNPVPSNPSLEF